MNNHQTYWHGGEIRLLEVDNYKFCPLCGESLIKLLIDHQQRSACPSCGYIHFRNPSPTVSLFIVYDEMVLLGKRTGEPGKDSWATPSGYIEFGEEFLTSAIREARKETNLEIEIVQLLSITESFFPPNQHFLNIYLLARVTGGELKAGDDKLELRWFSLDGLLPEMAFQEDIDLI